MISEHTDGEYARKGHSFIEDLDVPLPRAIPADIRESECGYQRGHMCPAGDNKWSYKAQKDAFLMTNICPQMVILISMIGSIWKKHVVNGQKIW